MKTVESRIAPNPKEAQIWVDLNADAHGLVKKYWNGTQWVIKDQPVHITEKDILDTVKPLFKEVNDQIADINTNIKFLNTYHDEYILKLIKELANRISKLEEFIGTE